MSRNLVMMAVGDICIGSGEQPLSVMKQVYKEGADLFSCFKKISPVLQQGDFVFGNGEGVICEPLPASDGKSGIGTGIVRMPPEAADALKRAGFHALAMANNHTMDFGVEGMLQTLNNLRRVGISTTGGGRNIHEARKPAILESAGVKLALLSYSSVFIPGIFPAAENKPGIATVPVSTSYEIPSNIMYSPGVPPRIITTPRRDDVAKVLSDVKKAKEAADLVVVNCHWGLTKWANAIALGLPLEDSIFYVLNYQEDLGRAIIDAGADMVIGHHPHRLQGIEVYKGKLICYSLGILTMPFSMGSNFGEEAVIVKAYIDPKTRQFAKLAVIPVMVPKETMEPYAAPVNETGSFISELEKLSKKYGTTFRAEGDEIVIGSPSRT